MPSAGQVAALDAMTFRLIGKRVTRLDSASKTDGRAKFALDVDLPGMLTTMIERPPVFGATVRSFDAAKAKAVPGVHQVIWWAPD